MTFTLLVLGMAMDFMVVMVLEMVWVMEIVREKAGVMAKKMLVIVVDVVIWNGDLEVQ